MKTKNESDIQREICEWLDKKGFFFWRTNNVPVFSQGRMHTLPKYTPKGLSDLIVLHKGIFYAIEVKRPKGFYKDRIRTSVATPEQVIFGNRVKENGGVYRIVDNLETIKNLFEFDDTNIPNLIG